MENHIEMNDLGVTPFMDPPPLLFHGILLRKNLGRNFGPWDQEMQNVSGNVP